MSPGAADILTRITTAAMRLGMGYLLAGRTRDAEQLATSLEALGHVPPVDVDAIEAEARRTLRQDEPTQGGPLDTSPTKTSTGRLYRQPIAPDFPEGLLGEGD